jgi:hypothetical protein
VVHVLVVHVRGSFPKRQRRVSRRWYRDVLRNATVSYRNPGPTERLLSPADEMTMMGAPTSTNAAPYVRVRTTPLQTSATRARTLDPGRRWESVWTPTRDRPDRSMMPCHEYSNSLFLCCSPRVARVPPAPRSAAGRGGRGAGGGRRRGGRVGFGGRWGGADCVAATSTSVCPAPGWRVFVRVPNNPDPRSSSEDPETQASSHPEAEAEAEAEADGDGAIAAVSLHTTAGRVRPGATGGPGDLPLGAGRGQHHPRRDRR